MKKRFLSSMLAILMILSTVPILSVTVFARPPVTPPAIELKIEASPAEGGSLSYELSDGSILSTSDGTIVLTAENTGLSEINVDDDIDCKVNEGYIFWRWLYDSVPLYETGYADGYVSLLAIGSHTLTAEFQYVGTSEPTAHTHTGADGKDVTFQPWEKTDSLPDASDLTGGVGSFYLTEDVTLSDKWTVPAGTVNLCLNGYTVTWVLDPTAMTMQTVSGGIEVGDGATLNLYDCKNTEHYGHIDATFHVWAADETAGDKNVSIFGGSIRNGAQDMGQYGIFPYTANIHIAAGGAMSINGGNIVGFNSDYGGVKNEGALTVTGGCILGNVGTTKGNGGGIYNVGKLEMSGGKIAYNYSPNGGGGVYNNINSQLTPDSYFKLKGGIISDNSAYMGGGIFSTTDAAGNPFELLGGAVEGNHAVKVSGKGGVGGGICSMGNIVIGGGTVQNNTDEYDGGGTADFAAQSSTTVSPNSSGMIRISENGLAAGTRIVLTPQQFAVEKNTITNAKKSDLQYFAAPEGYRVRYMDKTKEIGMIAVPKGNYLVNIDASEDGSVTAPDYAAPDAPVTVTVEPEPGHQLKKLTYTPEGGVTTEIKADDTGVYSFTMPSTDVTLAAEFEVDYLPCSHGVGDSHDETWTGTATLPTTAGKYYLTGDVTLTEPWSAPEGTTELCLNGHTITWDTNITTKDVYKTIVSPLSPDKTRKTCIVIPDGATLNICDCDDTEHYGHIASIEGMTPIDTDYAKMSQLQNLWIEDEAPTDKNISIRGGSIRGGYLVQENPPYATIYMTIPGSFTVESGGKLAMHGGNIVGCKMGDGGLILDYGSFTMTDGMILGNSSPDQYGKSVVAVGNETGVSTDGFFRLAGGRIAYNHLGNAVTVSAIVENIYDATYQNIIGKTNYKWGGNFEISGGTIDHNITGVHLQGGMVIGGGRITDNISTGQMVADVVSEGSTGMRIAKTGLAEGTRIGLAILNVRITNAEESDKQHFFSGSPYLYVAYDKDKRELFMEQIPAGSFLINEPICANGTLSMPVYAQMSTTVTITVEPAEGYKLKEDSLTVTYNNGSEDLTCQLMKISDTQYTFTMPMYPVTVNAEFEEDLPCFDPCNGAATSGASTAPTWTGYVFDGWYTARTGGTKVESGFASGTTYYAHWKNAAGKTVITVPVTVLETGISVDGANALSNPSDYGFTFTAATTTPEPKPIQITMNGVSIITTDTEKSAISSKFPVDFTITGTNEVTTPVADADGYTGCVGGIFLENSDRTQLPWVEYPVPATFGGDGTLTVTASGENAVAIYCSKGAMSFGGSVKVVASGHSGGIRANSGVLTFEESCDISATQSGTDVYEAAAVLSGLYVAPGTVSLDDQYVGIFIKDNAAVVANAVKGSAIEANASNIHISGGEVTAVGESAGLKSANSDNMLIQISDGKVNVSATAQSAYAFRVKNLNISGGNVTASAPSAFINDAWGEDTPYVTIADGLTAKASTSTDGSTLVDYVDTDKMTYKFFQVISGPSITVSKVQTGEPAADIENPVYGTAQTATDFFTVAAENFETAPTLKLEWKSVSAEGVETWSGTAPAGITAELKGNVISIATTVTLNAGDYEFRVTNGEDEFAEGTTPNPAFVSGTGVLTVEKCATLPEGTPTSKTVKGLINTADQTGNIDLTLLGVTLPGAAIKSFGTETDANSIVVIDTGAKTYAFANTSTKATATLELTIGSTNYQDYTFTLSFETVEKTPVTVSGVNMNKDSYTYGDTVGYTGTPSAATKDATPQSVTVAGWTYTYYQNTGTAQSPVWTALETTPANAGDYKLVVSVSEADENYTGSAELTFTIAKRTVTLIAGSNEKVFDGTPLTCTTFTVKEDTTTAGYGFVGGEGIQSVTMTPESTIADVGSIANVIATETPKEGTNLNNYIISTEPGTLKVTPAAMSVVPTAYEGCYDGEDHLFEIKEGNEVLTGGISYIVKDAAKAEITDATVFIREKGDEDWIPVAEFAPYKDCCDLTLEIKAEKANFADATCEVTFKIKAKELTVTITPNGGTYAGTVTGATATLNGLVTGESFDAVLTYTATDYNSTNVPTNAGTYTVTATLPASATNYKLTGTVTADFTIDKADMVVGTNILAPSVPVSELVYDGNAKELLCAGQTWDEKDGTTAFGTFYYSVDGKVWSTDLPTAINAGEYNPVWYFVGDENHNNIGSAEAPISQLYPIEITKGDQPVATVVMDGYTYGGTLSDPSISIIPAENATVTYYYSATNATAGGTEWKNMTATTLDAGIYYIYAVIGATDNYEEKTTEAVSFIVAKQAVEAPEISSKAYTGNTLTADVSASTLYTVTINNGGTTVGSYDVVLTLSDMTNYKWSDSDEATKTLTFTITKADNAWTMTPAVADVTYGTAISPVGAAKFGSVTITYVGTGDTVYNSATAPTNAGTYKATFSVTATDDYGALSQDVNFTIGKLAVNEPTVTGTYTYNGNEQSATISGKESYMTESGNAKGTNAGTYTITYTLDGNHEWATGSDGTVTWSIGKATAVITVDKTPITKTYGETVTLPTATSDFGTVTCDKVATDLVNAGTYTVTYTVAGTDNYNGATETVSVTINKLAVNEPTVTGTYTYTGNEQSATISGKESYMTESGNAKGTNAGTYTITYTLDGNHEWATGSDGTVTWSIAKAQNAIHDLTIGNWKDTESGSAPTATADFGADNIEYFYYKGASRLEAKPTTAGEYTVKAEVVGTENYNGATAEKSFTIYASQKSGGDIGEGETKPVVQIETENGFDPNVELEVEVVVKADVVIAEGHTAIVDYKELAGKKEVVAGVYDVRLLLNGVEIQPEELGSGTVVTVRMLIPEDLVGKEFRLVHVHASDDMQTIAQGEEAAVGTYIIDDDGYLVTKIDRFSEFVFLRQQNRSLWWLWILIAVIVIGGAGTTYYYVRKKKKNQ